MKKKIKALLLLGLVFLGGCGQASAPSASSAGTDGAVGRPVRDGHGHDADRLRRPCRRGAGARRRARSNVWTRCSRSAARAATFTRSTDDHAGDAARGHRRRCLRGRWRSRPRLAAFSTARSSRSWRRGASPHRTTACPARRSCPPLLAHVDYTQVRQNGSDCGPFRRMCRWTSAVSPRAIPRTGSMQVLSG